MVFIVDSYDDALEKAKQVQEEIRNGKLLELVQSEGLFEEDLSSDSEEERERRRDPFKNFQSRAFQRVLEEQVEGTHAPRVSQKSELQSYHSVSTQVAGCSSRERT